MTTSKFAAKIQNVAVALKLNVMDAERENLKDASKIADVLSSGPLSLQDMAKLGHPYAQSAPTASNPEVINEGGGRGLFRKSWRTTGPTISNGNVVSKLYNTDKNAKWLQGTRKAIARPVREAIIQKVTPGRTRRLRKAIAQALRG